MSTRRWAFVLAVGATGTALSLSILAGWQRGGSLPEQLVWVAIGLVLVTSAHLLPALLRGAPILVRGVGRLLWGACLVTTCFGHATFFTFAQQHAGEQRASKVPVVPTLSTARTLTTVMTERATVTAQLAAATARYCVGNCATLEARRATLAARLDALNAGADDIRHRQAADDRVTTRRDALLADPVTSRLAALLGTAPARIDLLTGLVFAAVLEGVACLLWTIALRSPSLAPLSAEVTPPVTAIVSVTADVTQPVVTAVTDTTASTQPVISPVAASQVAATVGRNDVPPGHDSTSRSHAPRDDPVTPLPIADPIDNHLTQLVRDVAAGLVRPTVTDIRRHLGCSQARAATLRRRLAEHNVTA
ncbi:MAG: hypothetical protein RXR20_28535 [Paraburkholderia sp.]|jgi:hypothetical protein|uniref:hypothetical protein n=1 Tax=Burkholderiaceae TaxID=119060 RepID=UPI0010F85138|nr:hypothetical protein [Burkholderia sp. 4M9327F10]